MTTLISLVGEQPLPNIFAAVGLKAQRHVLISTGDMEPIRLRTERVLRQLLPEAKFDHSVISAYDLDEARAVTERYCADDKTVVNVTGGTKLMAIGALQAAYSARAAVIYVDTANGQIRLISSGANTPFQPRQDRLPLPDVDIGTQLAVYGMKIAKCRHAIEPDEAAFLRLVSSYSLAWNVILRGVAIHDERHVGRRQQPPQSQFEPRTQPPTLSCETTEYAPLQVIVNDRSPFTRQILELLEQLRNSGVVRRFRWDDGMLQILLVNPKWLPFFQQYGYWLETFVHLMAVAAGFPEVLSQVKVEWEDSGVENEIDVILRSHSRLLLISCKAGVIDRVTKDALNELATLARFAGGLFAQKAFVMRLGASESFRLRAKELGIALLPLDGKTLGKKLVALRAI